MKRYPRFSLLLTCLVLVSMLLACGATPTAEPPVPTEVPAAQPTAVPEPVATQNPEAMYEQTPSLHLSSRVVTRAGRVRSSDTIRPSSMRAMRPQ